MGSHWRWAVGRLAGLHEAGDLPVLGERGTRTRHFPGHVACASPRVGPSGRDRSGLLSAGCTVADAPDDGQLPTPARPPKTPAAAHCPPALESSGPHTGSAQPPDSQRGGPSGGKVGTPTKDTRSCPHITKHTRFRDAGAWIPRPMRPPRRLRPLSLGPKNHLAGPPASLVQTPRGSLAGGVRPTANRAPGLRAPPKRDPLLRAQPVPPLSTAEPRRTRHSQAEHASRFHLAPLA